MTRVPKLSLGPLKTGIHPSLCIYDFTNYPKQNLIWTNRINSQRPEKYFVLFFVCSLCFFLNHVVIFFWKLSFRQFQSSQQNIIFPVEKLVRGDILVVMEHSALVSTEKVARFAFNTGMIPPDTTKLVFTKSDIDEACNDARSLLFVFFFVCVCLCV